LVIINWKQPLEDGTDDPEIHYGLIAQEVATVLNGVSTGIYNYDAEHDSHALRPSELIPVLIKAVQELAARVAVLEGK
jgi:hypothetical protein